jgi:hypothetical protein
MNHQQEDIRSLGPQSGPRPAVLPAGVRFAHPVLQYHGVATTELRLTSDGAYVGRTKADGAETDICQTIPGDWVDWKTVPAGVSAPGSSRESAA